MKVSLDRKISTNVRQTYTQKTQAPLFQNRVQSDSVCFSSFQISKVKLPNYTKKEQEAYNLAKELFNGNYRKDGVTPYFNHCEFVGNKLKQAGYDEDVVSAGFLHDVVEDIPNWTTQRLSNIFGQKVGNLVEEVSHKDPKADWDTKLKNYVSHLKTISPEGMAIAACDKMASLQDDIKAFGIEGPKLFDKLGASPVKQLYKHLSIYNIIMKRNRPKEPIAKEYNQNITAYAKFTTSIIINPRKVA